MFGLVPFAMRNDVDTMDNVFDRMMNVFDEPFMSGFHTPEFKVDVKDNGDSYDLKVGEGTASAFAINSGRMAVMDILAKEKAAKAEK